MSRRPGRINSGFLGNTTFGPLLFPAKAALNGAVKWKESKEYHETRRPSRVAFRHKLRRCSALPDLEGRLALSTLKSVCTAASGDRPARPIREGRSTHTVRRPSRWAGT